MKKRIMATAVIIAIVSGAFASNTYADNRENEVYGYYLTIGNAYGIKPELLQAIAYTESRYVHNAQNGECKGLCQINFRVHANRIAGLGVSDPWDDYSQILLCADYINDLRMEKYGEEIAWVLDRYNGFSKADYNAQNGICNKGLK